MTGAIEILGAAMFLLSILLYSLTSHATTYAPPSADPLFKSKLCMVKKDLPQGISAKVVKEANVFQFESTSKELFRFYFKPELKKAFPQTMSKQHLPVMIYENGALLDNFYGEWRPTFGTLAMKESSGINSFLGYSLETHWPYWHLDKNDLKNFLEIPLSYYYKDKFVKNKLKIYLKIKPPVTTDNFVFPQMEVIRGMFQQGEVSQVNVEKVLTESPLPPGFRIFPPTDKHFTQPELSNIYRMLKFEYNGRDPIFFVKEFSEAVFESNIIASGKIPDLIINGKNCFEYNSEFKFLAQKDKHKELYDNFYGQYQSILEQVKKTQDGTIKIKELIDSLRSIDLYYTQPLGFEFPGNGIEKSRCLFHRYAMPFDHNESVSKMVSATAPEKITIPSEEEKSIEVEFNKTSSRIRLIKKYVLNEDWEPLSDQQSELSSFNGAFGRPAQKKKTEKKDYLKGVKVAKEKSNFSDSELICLSGERI